MAKEKRGISPVIATVMLVLMAVAMVALLSAFLIPFIKNQMSKGKDCFESTQALEIDTENGMACKDSSGSFDVVKVTIKRNVGEVTGVKLALSTGTDSEVYDIKQGVEIRDSAGDYRVTMSNGTGKLAFLGREGESKTYIFSTKLIGTNLVTISPLVSSGSCKEQETQEIKEC